MDSEIVSAQEIFDALNDLLNALDECADGSDGHDDITAMIEYDVAEKAARQIIKRFNKL